MADRSAMRVAHSGGRGSLIFIHNGAPKALIDCLREAGGNCEMVVSPTASERLSKINVCFGSPLIRFDPFAKPSGIDRFLRTPTVQSVGLE
jgi:hypothetical protein